MDKTERVLKLFFDERREHNLLTDYVGKLEERVVQLKLERDRALEKIRCGNELRLLAFRSGCTQQQVLDSFNDFMKNRIEILKSQKQANLSLPK